MTLSKPVMLCTTGPMEEELSSTQKALIWKTFMDGGSSHSASCSTLPFVMRRCEASQVEYVLTAAPGKGYFIQTKEQHEKNVAEALDIEHERRLDEIADSKHFAQTCGG